MIVLSLVERGWQAAREYARKAEGSELQVLHVVKGRVARPVRHLIASSAPVRLICVARAGFWPVVWLLSIWFFLSGKLQAVLVDNERSLRRVRRWFPGTAVPVWEPPNAHRPDLRQDAA